MALNSSIADGVNPANQRFKGMSPGLNRTGRLQAGERSAAKRYGSNRSDWGLPPQIMNPFQTAAKDDVSDIWVPLQTKWHDANGGSVYIFGINMAALKGTDPYYREVRF